MFKLALPGPETVSFILKAALAVAAVVALGWALTGAYNAGATAERALQADRKALILETRTAAAEGAASVIAKIKPEYRTVIQRTRTIMAAAPAYRDCQHDQRVFDDINSKLGPPGKAAD